jgi:hypothetical protein
MTKTSGKDSFHLRVCMHLFHIFCINNSAQVPNKAEDYRFEEVGLYECCQGRLPQAEGRKEGDAVRVI